MKIVCQIFLSAVCIAAGSNAAASDYIPSDVVKTAGAGFAQCYRNEALKLEPSGADVEEILKALPLACANEENNLIVQMTADMAGYEIASGEKIPNAVARAAMARVRDLSANRARLAILRKRAKSH